MKLEKYLKQILKNQTFSDDDDEIKQLQKIRKKVEQIIKDAFGEDKLTIRYGGSKAKGTMIKESYDLDIVSYFSHDDNTAGETLKDIYNNVKSELEKDYYVDPKTSALRLKDKASEDVLVDFHIDVVPGRFVDDSEADVYLYQASGEKERLKTNLDIHIEHIRDSGKNDIIRLIKLWNHLTGLGLKTFILELLVVKYSKEIGDKPLSNGIISFWEYLKEHEDISIEDPANPEGNDLSDYLTSTKQLLKMYATNALGLIESGNWEGIFGPTEVVADDEKVKAVQATGSVSAGSSKPWCDVV